jgi:hypothetical protein
MSRPHVNHLLTDFMDETLSWQPTEKVKAHLAFCNACRQALNELKKGIALLGATPEATPSSDLERRIMNWMTVERAHPAEPGWTLPRVDAARVAGVIAAVAAIGALLFKLATHTPAPRAVAPVPSAPAPKKPEPKKDGHEKTVKTAMLSVAAIKAAEAKARADVMPAPLEGSHSGISEELTRVVDSPSAWRELWIRHQSKAERVPPLPDIDFSKDQVLAIFAGQKPTGGYKVQIVAMTETPWNGKAARVVKYRVQGPPKNALTTQVITEPFVFKVVPRFPGATFFEKSP